MASFVETPFSFATTLVSDTFLIVDPCHLYCSHLLSAALDNDVVPRTSECWC